MFGSNLLVDKVSIDYTALVCGLDTLLSNHGDKDKTEFVAANAREFYSVDR